MDCFSRPLPPFDSSDWLFLSLLILLINCFSLSFDSSDWLSLSLLILLFGFSSLLILLIGFPPFWFFFLCLINILHHWLILFDWSSSYLVLLFNCISLLDLLFDCFFLPIWFLPFDSLSLSLSLSISLSRFLLIGCSSLCWFLLSWLFLLTDSSIRFRLKWFDLVWLCFVWMISLFGWLTMMVFAPLSMMTTHFGCWSPLILLSVDLVYFSGLICNKLKD